MGLVGKLGSTHICGKYYRISDGVYHTLWVGPIELSCMFVGRVSL